MLLDLETSYQAILTAARSTNFISYGDVAKANSVDWQKVRPVMPKHLSDLLIICRDRGWPLLTAIVVALPQVKTGKLDGAALDGFIKDVRRLGIDVDDPEAYLQAEQDRIFAWAPSAPDTLGIAPGGPKFLQFFGPVLEAMKALGGEASPRDVVGWIQESGLAPIGEEERTTKSGQPSFENRIGWARFYLTKAGLLDTRKRGTWLLTQAGRDSEMNSVRALQLFRQVRTAEGYDAPKEEDAAPPEPDITFDPDLFSDPLRQFWFGGTVWSTTGEQMERFLTEGVWQDGDVDDPSEHIRQIRLGDRIAMKSSYVKKHGLPFDNHGKSVSVMKIKAIGTVVGIHKDECTVDVDWTLLNPAREWYFYTYRTTLARANLDNESARRLVQFAFGGATQDYPRFLQQPYWRAKYGADASPAEEEEDSGDASIAVNEGSRPKTYGVNNIIEDGCFLPAEDLARILDRLRQKKNLVLQGAPGTGKTWLAKRLARALIGEARPDSSQVRSIQFHPSFAYEDFLRGWRPKADDKGEGRLELVDGIFLEIIRAAQAEPVPHVLVIEEINRGNPAQLFGEMLTLLESSKRRKDEAIELAYRRHSGERVYIPDNLFVIGTMNIADRSLALVDLALRRRFAFVTLQPNLNAAWRRWCIETCAMPGEIVDAIASRMTALNERIAKDRSLGDNFCIGHSYVTPEPESVTDPARWFRDVVETEIVPLLEEYWFDAADKVTEAAAPLRVAL